ncbi:isochorismatase family protein [Actinomycetes bacterium KLBMP 9797]
MSALRVQPYEMPTEAELPANRVTWRPAAARAVLLVHDMQRYFVAPFGDRPPGTALVPTIARLRERCHRLGIPVVYTRQPGGQPPSQRGLLADFWGPGLGADPAPQSIVDELAPAAGDVVLTKTRYSAFRGTDLEQTLRGWGRDQLLVTGVYGHIGCLATACDAFMRDIQPFLVADAIGDFGVDEHRTALRYAATRCAAVTAAAAVLRDLPATDPRADVAELLGVPPDSVDGDADLTDQGLDSVRVMELVTRWRVSGVDVSFVDLAERPTLTAWTALLAARAAEVS